MHSVSKEEPIAAYTPKAFLRVNMFGYLFSEEFEAEFEKSLSAFPNRIVHGDWAPAASLPITVDLIISIAKDISLVVAGALASYAVTNCMNAVYDEANNSLILNPPIARNTVFD